jgi:hypothetical protein
MDRPVARMGEINAYNNLFETPEGKRPLGRPGRGYEDDIKMDLMERWCEDVDWIHVARDGDPMACSCERDTEHSGSIKDGEFLD